MFNSAGWMFWEMDLESNGNTAAMVDVISAVPADQVAEVVKSSMQEKLETLKSVLGVHTFASFFKGLKREIPALMQVKEYSKPTNLDEVKLRFQANVSFFKFTYTTICSLVTAMFVLSSPVLLVLGMLLAFVWMWVLGQTEPTTVIAGREFGARERYTLAVVATVLYVVLGGVISTIVYILTVNVLIVGSHASMRQPVVLDELEIMEQETDAIIQDSAGV